MKPKPLKDKGRWANEDLYLEYSQCAIENSELKEHCISLWFKNDDIKSAVEWYLQETKKPIFPKYNKLYDEWCKSKSKLNYKVWLVLKAFEDVCKK